MDNNGMKSGECAPAGAGGVHAGPPSIGHRLLTPLGDFQGRPHRAGGELEPVQGTRCHLTHDEATFDRALGEFTREHVQGHIDETDRADFEADCERVLDIFLAVWNGDMDDTP
jgi:hypothetical protein